MPKPIAVLYLPTDEYLGPYNKTGYLMSAFNGCHHEITMPDAFYDYLWFVFVNEELNTPDLKVFHEKDFTEIQYSELKAMLEEELSKLKNIQQSV